MTVYIPGFGASSAIYPNTLSSIRAGLVLEYSAKNKR